MLLDNQNVEDLIKRLHCNRPSCPNENNYCYELDGIHLKVMAPHLKTWSICINENTASLEAPPNGLIADLMPSKAGTYNPLRSVPAAKSTKSIMSPETTFSSSTTPLPPVSPFSQYPTLPPYYYHPYGLPPSQMHHSLPSIPVHVTHPTQFSDSIIDEQDPLEKLIAYFSWLAIRSPMQAAALNIAKETLLEEGHTFRTLEKLSQVDLEKTGIKSGIAMQLKSYLDLFKRKTMNVS